MLNRLIDVYFIKKPRFRRLVTKLLYGSRPAEVTLLGAPMFIHTEYENGYLRASQRARRTSLFRDEVGVMINLAALIEDGTSFVDIGANIGVYSSVLSRLAVVKKDFSIFAFEADPKTFERLSQNSDRHGFHAENVALTEREGEMEFIRGAVSHVTTKTENANKYNIPGETFIARCRPLGSFDIPGSSIILKIDVEGAEYEVLMGAEKFFLEGRVKAVYLDGVEKMDETVAFLKKYGFRFFGGRTLAPMERRIFSVLAVRATDLP